MGRKLLILHVGLHKTGTTALQHQFLNSRSFLENHSVAYPEIGIIQFAHHGIYNLLSGRVSASAELSPATLRTELVSLRHEITLLSSEDFVYLSRERLAGFRSLLPEFEVQIVMFIRSPVDLWPSHWQELVKHGRDATLADYLSAVAGWSSAFDAKALHPVWHAAKFANVFGRHALRIFSYDNVISSKVDLFSFFCGTVLGIEEPAPAATKRVNSSLPSEMIELLRCLNQEFSETRGCSPQNLVLKHYQMHRKTIEASETYLGFVNAFRQHASRVTLEGNQEIIRNREQMLMNRFGDRIENKAGEAKLNSREEFRRIVKFGERYWTSRFGQDGFVQGLLASFGEI